MDKKYPIVLWILTAVSAYVATFHVATNYGLIVIMAIYAFVFAAVATWYYLHYKE